MPTKKDAATERFRKCLAGSKGAVETSRADPGVSTLSFRSASHPERHVWVDTALSGESVLDLEDWRDDTQWDNSVAHASSQDLPLLSDIARTWLTGNSLEACKEVGGTTVTWQ